MVTADANRAGRALVGEAGASRLQARAVDFDARDLGDIVRAAVEAGGELWLRASGASMWPTILDDEQVLLARAGTIRRGDVVLVQGVGRVMLHRVTRIRSDRIVTWGDACLAPDPEVPGDHVLARAVACYRPGVHARPIAALECTLRFGTVALARWGWRRARLALARRWRAFGR